MPYHLTVPMTVPTVIFKGMYSSANQVCFVNLDDYFDATNLAIRSVHQKTTHYTFAFMTLTCWHLSRLAPYCREWIRFCASEGELDVEIRTKSANFAQLSKLKPVANVILARLCLQTRYVRLMSIRRRLAVTDQVPD